MSPWLPNGKLKDGTLLLGLAPLLTSDPGTPGMRLVAGPIDTLAQAQSLVWVQLATPWFDGHASPPSLEEQLQKYIDPGDGYLHTFNQSWWCGYGPSESPDLVVCALIENGGHGGDAAAPAALKVFEAFFRKQATQTGPIHSD